MPAYRLIEYRRLRLPFENWAYRTKSKPVNRVREMFDGKADSTSRDMMTTVSRSRICPKHRLSLDNKTWSFEHDEGHMLHELD